MPIFRVLNKKVKNTMKPPTDKTFKKNRRPARSIKEIRRRQLGEAYLSPLDRLVYALLSGLMYGFVGLVIDITIVIIRSILDIGHGEMLWLFAPFLLLLGALIGLIFGKNVGADSVNALNSDPMEHPYIDAYTVRHDIFRGIVIGVILFGLIWLTMLLVI